jgi:membrane-associated phospholipid phosphatase
MRDRRCAFALTAMLLATSTARAQGTLGSERRDLSSLRGDVWATLTSPARIDRRDVAPIGVAAAIIIGTVPFDSSIRAWMVTHPRSPVMRLIDPFREHRSPPLDGLGSWPYLAPLYVTMYATGRLSHSAPLRDAGLGCAAAHVSSIAIREIIYLGVSRVRPDSTANPRRISVPGARDWTDHSFLSGHIANSMACASFVAHRFDAGLGAPAMYVYASAIGAGRMADGWHWPSDTIAGGVLGYAIGKFVAGRQLVRAAGGSAGPRNSNSVILDWKYVF